VMAVRLSPDGVEEGLTAPRHQQPHHQPKIKTTMDQVENRRPCVVVDSVPSGIVVAVSPAQGSILDSSKVAQSADSTGVPLSPRGELWHLVTVVALSVDGKTGISAGETVSASSQSSDISTESLLASRVAAEVRRS
jgi:hypothetical protein